MKRDQQSKRRRALMRGTLSPASWESYKKGRRAGDH